MGYSQEGSIKRFWPDDTDDEFYVAHSEYLDDILTKINLKWPGCSMGDIEISAEYINTECLTYDCYDAGDYTNFLKITKVKR